MFLLSNWDIRQCSMQLGTGRPWWRSNYLVNGWLSFQMWYIYIYVYNYIWWYTVYGRLYIPWNLLYPDLSWFISPIISTIISPHLYNRYWLLPMNVFQTTNNYDEARRPEGPKLSGSGGLVLHPYVLHSSKHTKNYGKSPCLLGKPTINGHFQ
jgi:hypothetical protein